MKFGDYCRIEMSRYGRANEFYTHKVIQSLKSNVWVDVPVQSPGHEEIHDECEPVLRCICCGIDETRVLRYRVEDVEQCEIDNDKSPRFVVSQ